MTQSETVYLSIPKPKSTNLICEHISSGKRIRRIYNVFDQQSDAIEIQMKYAHRRFKGVETYWLASLSDYSLGDDTDHPGTELEYRTEGRTSKEKATELVELVSDHQV